MQTIDAALQQAFQTIMTAADNGICLILSAVVLHYCDLFFRSMVLNSEVIALLKEASRKYEQTILMITHSRGIAQTADRILEVSDGVLRDFGSTPDLRDMSTLRREEGRGECR